MTTAEITLFNGRKVQTPTGLFIDNKWVAASEGGTFSTINPATEEHLVDIALATAADVDIAVAAARKG